MYVVLVVAYAQSMVRMKNFAKAAAPAAVCWAARTGMTGGFSPRRTLGPVVGTSAGIVGVDGDDGLVVTGVVVAGVVETGGVETVDEVLDGGFEIGGVTLGVGSEPPELVQAETSSTAAAINPRVRIDR